MVLRMFVPRNLRRDFYPFQPVQQEQAAGTLSGYR
jgi:hypothetical protein